MSFEERRNHRGSGLDKERAHVAHFAIVDHGKRRLHAVEQLDQQHQTRCDVDLVQYVCVIGRYDGETEDLPEAGSKDEEPDQRAHERGDEALALMQEAQSFPPNDAFETDGVLRRREPRRPSVAHHLCAHELSCPASIVCVSRMKAERISRASAPAIICAVVPCVRTRPRCRTTT